jgi:hypothetical protein
MPSADELVDAEDPKLKLMENFGESSGFLPAKDNDVCFSDEEIEEGDEDEDIIPDVEHISENLGSASGPARSGQSRSC